MTPAFLQLTFIIVSAALLAFVFRLLKQPDILAYLILGVFFGAFNFFGFKNTESLELLSTLGITLLLFMVGLELSSRELISIGRVALLTGLGQIIISTFLGFFLSLILGFSPLPALYLSLALTFSSTIIGVKLLSAKQDLQSLYGKITVGFLLVQDFVAILALIVLSSFGGGEFLSVGNLLFTIIRGGFLFVLILYLSQAVFPKLADLLARDADMLFLLSFAWCLGFAAFVASPLMGFSVEIGGFLAGVALANSLEHFQIAARMRPLRDLFIVLFFILLGSRLNLSFDPTLWGQGIILSLFVMVAIPLIVMAIMGIVGYRKRTSFLVAASVAQISEFSFILVALGEKSGHLESRLVSLVTLVGVMTMTLSSYLFFYANKLYSILAPALSLMERKTGGRPYKVGPSPADHVILVGGGRTGLNILKALLKKNFAVLLIDHNPHVLAEFKDKVPVLYGDISESEIQQQAHLKEAKVMISTVPDLFDNLSLLAFLGSRRKRPRVVVKAKTIVEAKELYKAGADYVLLPHLIAGEHLKSIIEKDGDIVKKIQALRCTHLDYLT